MPAAVRSGLVQNTDAWLAARRGLVTASKIPVICGESPYASVLSLWAEDTGLVEAEEPDAERAELFELGHLMEPVLLELYERRTGRKPRRSPELLTHPEIPWAGASLDAVAPVRRIVEAKWSNASRWGSEGIPFDVELQVQWAMFVTGWEVADVVALVGRSARVVEVRRDDGLIADVLPLAEDYHRHVADGTQPPTDGSEATRRALARMHPRDDGEVLPATPDLVGLVAELRAAKAAKADAEALEATVSNALRAVLGDCSGIAGLVTYRKNADSSRVNWPAVAIAYRDRLADHATQAELDELVASNTQTAEGPRVLRLVKEKAQ